MTQALHKFTASVSTIVTETGETTEYAKSLLCFQVYSDYTQNAFPLYELVLRLTANQRDYIVKNSVNFVLTVDRYSVSADTDNGSAAESTATVPTIDKELFSLQLHPIDKPIISLYPDVESSDSASGSSDTENAKEQYYSYTVYCVSNSDSSYNDAILNDCYANANVNEIMINTISSFWKKDIYIQESNNTTRYDTLLIPPMAVIPALRYLHDAYMVYNNHMNVFFGANKMFVFDITEKNRAFDNSLSIQITPSTDNSNKSLYKCAQTDDAGNVFFYMKNSPALASIYDIYRNKTGGQTVFGSYDDSYNVTTRSYHNDDAVAKTRYRWNEQKDKSFETRLLNDISQMVPISIDNLDPMLIDPATKITINGSDIPTLNAQYALMDKTFSATTTDFTNYTGMLMLTLGRLA